MPGVVISTSVRTGPSTATVRESSQLFVVGLADRGPSDEAVLVQSIAEFEAMFGDYRSDSYLHPTVETFFEEGGTQAYVARVVGASATVGTLVLNNSSAVNCITLTANGAGAWSSDVEAEVTVSGATAKLNLSYDGTLVYTTGNCSTSSQMAGRINSSAIASRYVTASIQSTTTLPAAIASTPLAAGNAYENQVTSTYFVNALTLFNDALGTGAVSCPEISNDDVAVRNGLVAHANNYSRIAILHGGAVDSAATIKATALALQAEDNAEHAAIYYPWVTVPSGVAGVTRTIPPDGYVAAKRAVAHNQTGPHLPAAGLISTAKFVTGAAVDIDKTTGDDLDENYVNAIRVIQNTVRIYGARSLSVDTENFRYITQQDVVNTIVTECYRSLEDLVFSTIDGRNTIFANIEARLVVILAGMRDLGALYPAFDANGKQLDNGYTVKCDAGINPAAQLQTGLVKARVGVRVSSVGDKIEIDIVKSNLTSTVV
jgi:hypothetical protein